MIQATLDLILLCVVILTIDPARKLYQEYENWKHRQQLHEEDLRRKQS